MGAMAESTPSGWLPPTAPGAGPRPRFDAPPEPPAPAAAEPPAPAQAEPPRAGPTFTRAAPRPGARNGAAVWAVVLGITGLALLVLSLGSLFVLTLPCSVAAWVLAARARRQIESGATSHGDGQATAALWLGRIGVIAGVAAMVVFVALLASGFDFEQFRDDLQRELDRRRQRENGGDGVDGVRTGLRHLRAAVGPWPAR
jgi:hypothetical protein